MSLPRALEGRTALVTGGGSGIGRAIARALSASGAACRLAGRRREPLEATAAMLEDASAHVCDVRDGAAVAALVASLEPLDVLVDAAGIIHAGAVHELDPDDVEDLLRTNLLGAFHLLRAVLPGMRARGRGDIVVVSSIATERSFPTMGAYAASKAGLEALVGVAREENREAGIRVLEVVAGATSTELWSGFWPDAPRDRMMAPDDVAGAVRAALTLPESATLERIVIRPRRGDL
jgi:ribitol 2-dehydrogenase